MLKYLFVDMRLGEALPCPSDTFTRIGSHVRQTEIAKAAKNQSQKKLVYLVV